MVYVYALVLVVVWAAAAISSWTLGGLVHVFLPVAFFMVIAESVGARRVR